MANKEIMNAKKINQKDFTSVIILLKSEITVHEVTKLNNVDTVKMSYTVNKTLNAICGMFSGNCIQVYVWHSRLCRSFILFSHFTLFCFNFLSQFLESESTNGCPWHLLAHTVLD